MKAQSDVQSQKSEHYDSLNWVGMSKIQTMIRLMANELPIAVPTLLDLGVDLAENNRGIHMSRLYRLHQEKILNQVLSDKNLAEFAADCLASQKQTSQNFACKLKLNWPMQTMSLKSLLPGFRNYPVEVIFEKTAKDEKLWLQFEVLYSSTCPQSAGLAMEVLKKQPGSLDRLPATPHAQRSRAVVQLQLTQVNQQVIETYILQVEQALGTPVQTAVKKEDEMRFAELNAENLMFCEDAARKIAGALVKNQLGFKIFCEHEESLHSHNASSLKQYQFCGPQLLQFG